jgi:hypothetical protein
VPKIIHWTLDNGSGLDSVAKDIVKAERALGLDSLCVSSLEQAHWKVAVDADIHCVHSHIPDGVKRSKVVWFQHGTPEYTLQTAIMEGLNRGYGAGDSWMLQQYWMKHSDAIVTFWPRHEAILRSMCDKHTRIECIPMGVETDFWKPIDSRGKYAGEPSLFTAENCHFIKWPFDLFVMLPWIAEEIPKVRLHAFLLPYDQHRWWFPLINSNGAAFSSFISGHSLSKEDLRNAFCSTDFFIGLVRYGDFNKLCLEAAACNAKLISYAGNPFSHYWITEGDQRQMVKELIAVLKNEIEPRKDVLTVPDIADTAKALANLYESL